MSLHTAISRSIHRRASVRALSSVNGLENSRNALRWRGVASVAGNDNELPLKGYRVLDMTRVLAGVSFLYFIRRIVTKNVIVAILHANTGRSWVPSHTSIHNPSPAHPRHGSN